ncbi:Uncharacterised protein [Burkholderia cenocepacia]|nr:Uncharacterised protein [Burkholderia cenocepacia]
MTRAEIQALRDDQRGRVAQRDEPEAKMRAFRRGGRRGMHGTHDWGDASSNCRATSTMRRP